MASYAIMDADIRFGEALLRFFSSLLPVSGSITDAEEGETRARRDFMLEMLDRNPDAFASEQDVQAMMRLYPGQF